MAIEIERKFLVCDDSWRDKCYKMIQLRQGYLTKSKDCTVRVRVSDAEAWLTIKGKSRNISRSEFEYLIPREDAENMLLELAGDRIIEKTRYFIRNQGTEWVLDEFSGRNRGLVLAEIELNSENAIFEKPEWIGEEVSGDYRYCNSNLSVKPYSDWEK